MGTTPEIIELMKLQLRKWQFSESFIEFVEMLGPQERSMHSQQRKLLEAVEHVISAFSHTQQAGLLLAENADIDAILIALAYQAALLDQLATSSRDNSDTNGYEALVSSMRKNVLPLVKQLECGISSGGWRVRSCGS